MKRVMRRDFKKLRRSHKGNKIVDKKDWILLALNELNDKNQADIGLGANEFDILKKALKVNPHNELTPF